MTRCAGPLCGLALLTCAGNPTSIVLPPEGAGTLRLELVESGFASPVYLTTPPGDTARLFVVEQGGQISIIQHGVSLPTPFLDITSRVASGGERGLLSVAFHPSYAANGFFYVNYTDLNGDTRVERYTVSVADSNLADTATHKLILFIPQPYSNHNGGLVLFGPDGMLYIGMGDGGSGGDPQNRAQHPDSLLGKLLRIDLDHGDPYAIPANNPFATSGGAPEIWALGLRNPWRFSFDPPSGLLYTGDVGQNTWEEVDVEPASQGGLNYGWRIMEGAHCYNPDPCSSAGLVLPVLEYPVQLRRARAAGARVLPRGRLLRHRWVRVSRYSFPGARGPVLLLGLLPGLVAERQVREWGRREPDALEPRRQPRKRVVLRTGRPWRAVRAVGERRRVPDRAIAVVDSPG